MIQIYSRENTDYNKNGDMVLFPEDCTLKAELNGIWKIELTHPVDDEGRYKYIEEESVLKVQSFLGSEQLFRICSTVKGDTEVTATAYPIFFDSQDDCMLIDTRPTEKNGQEALDIMTKGSRYSGKSDIKTVSTAYFERRNLMSAISGSDDPTFLGRWGGEIIYDNYTVIINSRVGGDYGVEARYGKNITGIESKVDMSGVVTRIIPVAYNGYTIGGKSGHIDSPIIGKYAKVYTQEIRFEDVKMQEDASEDDVENGVTVCESQEELDKALEKKCEEQFELGIDKPSVSMSIDLEILAGTEEYKEYAMLEDISLGDTVNCIHSKLEIETQARAVSIEYDCITEKVKKVVLGDFKDNYYKAMISAVERVKEAIRPDGSVVAEQVYGIINGVAAQMRAMKSVAQTQHIRAMLFEDRDPESPTYGAMCIGTMGFEIASEMTEDGRDWKWRTFGTGQGFFADLIVAGTMLADRIKGGTLTLGGWNNEDGLIIMNDAKGNQNGRWDNDGILSTGHYVSDNPADKRKADIYNGEITLSDYNGNSVTIRTRAYGSGKAALDILPNPQENGTFRCFTMAPDDMSAQNKNIRFLAEENITLSGKKLLVGTPDMIREAKTGTAEFSDGSYLTFQHGVLTGGRTASGSTF